MGGGGGAVAKEMGLMLSGPLPGGPVAQATGMPQPVPAGQLSVAGVSSTCFTCTIRDHCHTGPVLALPSYSLPPQWVGSVMARLQSGFIVARCC